MSLADGPMLTAIVVTLAIVVLGYGLRRVGLVPDEAWGYLSRGCYWVLFPGLLFNLMSTATLGAAFIGSFVLTLAAGSALIVVYALVMVRVAHLDGPAAGSLIQGSLRHNGFVVLSIVQGAYGAAALEIVAVAIAFLVPVSNIVSITALISYKPQDANTSLRRAIIQETARNPLLAAILAGVLVNLFAIPVPEVVSVTCEVLGNGALPLLLLGVGASLRFSAIRSNAIPLGLAIIAKLAIFPLCLVLIGIQLGLAPLPLAVIAAVGAAPTATSSFALASELGGDTRLMAEIISVQTLVAALSMPLWIWLSVVLAGS